VTSDFRPECIRP